MARTSKTFTVTLRGSERTEFGFRTAFDLTGRTTIPKFEVTVTTIEELEAEIDRLAATTDRPTGTEAFPVNAFLISVDPTSGRWPPGFKARFDKNLFRTYEDLDTITV